MDSVIATTLALLVTYGIVISFVQERWLSHLDGPTAFRVNVLISLGVAIFATFKSGFLGMLPVPTDLFGFALNVTATASVIIGASKAAFEWITKPVRDRASKP